MDVFSLKKKGRAPHGHRILKALLGALLLLLVAFSVGEIMGWPFLRGPLQQQLSSALQRPVEIGDNFELKVLGSLRAKSNSLIIGPASDTVSAESTKAPALLQAKDLSLAIPYSSLWKFNRPNPQDPPRIRLVEIGYLKAHLARDASGKANWESAQPEEEQSEETVYPIFDRLVLRSSDIHVDDRKEDVMFDAKVSTTEGNDQGEGLKITADGEYHDQALSVEISSSGIMPLLGSTENSQKVPLAFRATAGKSEFTFQGEAADVLRLNGVSGDISLKGPSLATVGDLFELTLPSTSPFWLRGRLVRQGDEWALQEAKLDAGRSRLSGNFVYDQRPEIPTLNGELLGHPLWLADLAPALGAAPGDEDGKEDDDGNDEKASAPDRDGHVLPRRDLDIPSLHRMNADIKLRLKKVSLGTAFQRPLRPLNADLRLQNGVLSISNVLARTADGEVSGGMVLNASKTEPQWKVDLKWGSIDLEKWLAPKNPVAEESRNTGAPSSEGYLSGQLHGSADLSGTGSSTAQMLGSLDGNINLWIRQGQVSQLLIEALGLDIAEALGVVIQGDENLAMRCAIVSMKAKNGTLTPDVAIIDTPDSTIFAEGQVSLQKETMNIKVTAKPKDKSPLTLRSPLLIQGRFATPDIELQKQQIGLKLLGASIMAALAPLAALIPLVDMGDEEEAGGCGQALKQLQENKD